MISSSFLLSFFSHLLLLFCWCFFFWGGHRFVHFIHKVRSVHLLLWMDTHCVVPKGRTGDGGLGSCNLPAARYDALRVGRVVLWWSVYMNPRGWVGLSHQNSQPNFSPSLLLHYPKALKLHDVNHNDSQFILYTCFCDFLDVPWTAQQSSSIGPLQLSRDLVLMLSPSLAITTRWVSTTALCTPRIRCTRCVIFDVVLR